MKKISVDFNTLNSTPLDKLKLGHEGTPNGDRLPALVPGERVLFFDSEMQVEGTVEYELLRGQRYWLGVPDWSTLIDTKPILDAEEINARP